MTGKEHLHETGAILARAALVSGLLVFASCAARPYFSEGVMYATATTYAVGQLPDTWKRVEGFGGDVGFIDKDTGAVVLANASCDEYEDASLSVLTKHLLIGFTARETLSAKELTLDGREALETTLAAELDGVPVKMTLVVLKKNHCVYDMSLIAPVDLFDGKATDFAAFVQGFSVMP